MRLKNKIALITGGAMGMGRATAVRFSAEGAAVVIADINAEVGEKTAGEIQAQGGVARFIKTDVSKAADCEAMVQFAIDSFGRLDVCYANAAVQMVGKDARAHEVSEETFDLTIAINLKGMWLTCKYALAAMLKSGGGSIIIAGSPTGLTTAGAGYTAYSTSKGGDHALMRVMAADYARDGIRVNAVVPGPMATPLTRNIIADPKVRAILEAQTLLGRIGKEDDTAALLVFLASDESSYCTGGFYMADGGMTAM
jgi:NAD(P)-dependent dehydrogenase (short-subunit alcohol dehydrogenase family)